MAANAVKPRRPSIGFSPVHGGDMYESPGMYMWDGKPARRPKKGEHYLSGAKVQAWKAPQRPLN